MFDIGENFTAAMDMMRRCFTDFSLNVTEIGTQLTACGLTVADYGVVIAGAVLIFCVSLIQERHADTTMRELLAVKHPRCQWVVLMIGLLAIAVFGVYGPGYDAADFVYMQF